MSTWSRRAADDLSEIFNVSVVPLNHRGDSFIADQASITERQVQSLIDQGLLEGWQDDMAPDCGLGDGQLYVIAVLDGMECFLAITPDDPRGVYFTVT